MRALVGGYRVQVPKYRVCRGFYIRNRNYGVLVNALYLGTWTLRVRAEDQHAKVLTRAWL